RTLPVPGLAERGIAFKTVGEAIYLRNHVLSRLDAAATTIDPDLRRRLLTFLVVGGGYAGIEALAELQDMLYAQDRWAVLLIFQAMDAAGKDSAIKHVMSGLNPQGTQVTSFKKPSDEEIDHDFLWRCVKALPERGRIGIFNRSYYEEVLVVRVHQEILERQKLPARVITKDIWRERFQDINAFERHLSRSGVLVRKFFLHLSKREQRRRLLARLDDPSKHWKFAVGDLDERDRWGDYMRAYEAALSATSTRHAPWYVVPADHKWFTRIVIADLVVDALASLDLAVPALSKREAAALATARARLEGGLDRAKSRR
ncbi:MAG TPA: PPK2 family polyphosphate kinase, partial [Vicinamibacterales bacterium]|nr:PPK2 family polyphosphate kinase [Vicinamibacterales bacterium]